MSDGPNITSSRVLPQNSLTASIRLGSQRLLDAVSGRLVAWQERCTSGSSTAARRHRRSWRVPRPTSLSRRLVTLKGSRSSLSQISGIPVCTLSVYCDMALTLRTYLVDKYRSKHDNKLVDVTTVSISTSLTLSAAGNKQLLQAHADVAWAHDEALVKFTPFNANQLLQEQSRCTLERKRETCSEARKGGSGRAPEDAYTL